MTGQTKIGITRNIRLKESPILFQHKDIQFVETNRDQSAPRPQKQQNHDLKSVFLIKKPDSQFSMTNKLSNNPLSSILTKKRQSQPQNNPKPIQPETKQEPPKQKVDYLKVQNFPKPQNLKKRRVPHKKSLEQLLDTQTIEIFIPSSPAKDSESKSLINSKPVSSQSQRRYGAFNFTKQTVATLESDVVADQGSLNILDLHSTAPQSSKNFKVVTESKSIGTADGSQSNGCQASSIYNIEIKSAVKMVHSEDEQMQTSARQSTLRSRNSASTLNVPLKNKAIQNRTIEQRVPVRKAGGFDEHCLNQIRRGLEKEAAQDKTKTRLHKFIATLQEQRKNEGSDQFSPNRSEARRREYAWHMTSSRLGSGIELQPQPARQTTQALPRRQGANNANLIEAQQQWEQRNTDVNYNQLVHSRQILNNSLQKSALKARMKSFSQCKAKHIRINNLRAKKLSIISPMTVKPKFETRD